MQTPTLAAPQLAQVQAQPVYTITEDDKARQKVIAEAWKAYDGDFEPHLEKTPEGIDPNVVINQISPIVDTGVDFLFGQEIEISVEKGAPQAAQDFLNDAWGEKEVRIPLLQDLAMNGAMARTAFLRIVPSSDKPGKEKTYRLVAVDPSTVNVEEAPQDCETVFLYCIQFSSKRKSNGKDVTTYYREEITRIGPDGSPVRDNFDPKTSDDDTWSIQHWSQDTQHGMQPKDTSDWTPAGEPITWPYPFPPLFHCKNLPRPNDFWGRADVRKDLVGMDEKLNLDQSCIMLDQIIYGNPILYANGMGDGSIERRSGRIIQLPLIESKITAVAIPSDIPNALAFAADLRSSVDEVSGVPGVATGRIKDMPRGNLSGIAIELLFMRLLKQTGKKQCLYGKLIIDVSKALLVLAGFNGDIKITLEWANPLPHEDLPTAQYAAILKTLGISNATIQRMLGFDPEEEQKLSQAEDEIALAKQQKILAMQQFVQPNQQPGQPFPQPAPAGAQLGPAAQGGKQ